ncbi:MAG: IclR family transcriptional regulator [Firmicutes bacterium]|nr:IclR family transcriptional regulator [Bacillota bacterium]
MTAVLARGLDLLASLGEDLGGEATVAELARAVGLPASTAYRYVAVLRRAGLLEEGERPGSVRIGLRLIALAWNAPPRRITALARPVMEALSNATGETVLLIEPFGTQAICTERVESREAVRLAFEKGRVLPLHAGASVRALLAFSPPALLQAVLAGELRRFTPATITDPAALAENLEAVRQAGYAWSDSEMDPGVSALAMPVCGGGRYAQASLSVTGPSFRLTRQRASAHLLALRQAVEALDEALGRNRLRRGRRPADGGGEDAG